MSQNLSSFVGFHCLHTIQSKVLEPIFDLSHNHAFKASIRTEMSVSPDEVLILAESRVPAEIMNVESSN